MTQTAIDRARLYGPLEVPLGAVVGRSLAIGGGAVLAVDSIPRNFQVYVVRDGDTVLYVGITTQGIERRLEQHIESRSPLGHAIIDSAPASNEWALECVDPGRCLPAIQAAFPNVPIMAGAESLITAGMAESALILLLQPRLNRALNGRG